jgi:hypothetical protein
LQYATISCLSGWRLGKKVLIEQHDDVSGTGSALSGVFQSIAEPFSMKTLFTDFLVRFARASTIANAGNGADVVQLLQRRRGPEDDYGLSLQSLEEDEGLSARRFSADSAALFSVRPPGRFAMHR